MDEVYDAFVERVVARALRLRMGDPSDPAVTFGPLVSEEAFQKTLTYLGIAREEGKVVLGGAPSDREGWVRAGRRPGCWRGW